MTEVHIVIWGSYLGALHVISSVLKNEEAEKKVITLHK